MKIRFSPLFIVMLFFLTSCNEYRFISDKAERERVEKDFNQKQKEMSFGNLFQVFDQKLTDNERDALMFLYAYMPIGDVTDYSGDYYLANIKASFQTREEMPWGKTIPEREFRHFVLPVRVNNENMDSSRMVFYAELKDRVKNLPLKEAILEVNHWCHEKVVYAPSDSRTSSPMASVKSAYGRCGEESTFLVAALRSVGIPARQVYTPRWAHTDDNHAWVEAWADGKWHFLGACEPEPVLNLGWFNAPASRGMLMHTKVFGHYTGPEEVMRQTGGYTEINVISNYAPSAKGKVIVTDSLNNVVPKAQVEFKLYNYAELYTVARKTTDKDGLVTLSAGKGDMVVFASNGTRFGFAKFSFGKDTVLTVKLDKKKDDEYAIPFDIVPPVENKTIVEVTPEQRAVNDKRMAHEDSIRNAYTATFYTPKKAAALALELKLDSTEVAPLIVASRGNHQEIISFIKNTPENQRANAVKILQSISEKDLRDTPASILNDHLQNTPANASSLYIEYILNPRISVEMLTPYKSFFAKEIKPEMAAQIKEDPNVWIKWCKENIAVRNDLNEQRVVVSPEGVWKSRMADERSRKIFFVAVLRSLGIPSRVDEVTGKTQYADNNGQWIDVAFEQEQKENAPTGELLLTYEPTKSLENPKYGSHFSISRYDNGSFSLLNYPEGDAGSWSNLCKNPLILDEGYYMLVTGTRLANGSVLNNTTLFDVRKGEKTTIELVMRENNDEIKVIGNFNSEATYKPESASELKSILQTTGRGYFITAILGAKQEPTNHALKDIAAKKAEFEKWGRQMVFLFPNETQLKGFHKNEFPGLPSNITFGTDPNNAVQKMIMENMKLKGQELPIFIIADTFNRVVFVSQGYTIGLGEQLLKVINKL